MFSIKIDNKYLTSPLIIVDENKPVIDINLHISDKKRFKSLNNTYSNNICINGKQLASKRYLIRLIGYK